MGALGAIMFPWINVHHDTRYELGNSITEDVPKH